LKNDAARNAFILLNPGDLSTYKNTNGWLKAAAIAHTKAGLWVTQVLIYQGKNPVKLGKNRNSGHHYQSRKYRACRLGRKSSAGKEERV